MTIRLALVIWASSANTSFKLMNAMDTAIGIFNLEVYAKNSVFARL
jgi:hypothetical protein